MHENLHPKDTLENFSSFTTYHSIDDKCRQIKAYYGRFLKPPKSISIPDLTKSQLKNLNFLKIKTENWLMIKRLFTSMK